MRVIGAIWISVEAMLLISCNRTSSPPPAPAPSVDQRVSDIEAYVNSGSPSMLNQAEAKLEYIRDLAEIRSMGLVDRAAKEFTARTTNAVVDNCRIGYFMDTNVVWCEFRYHHSGSTDPLQEDFGYQRKSGKNWTLMAK